jgi:NifU-like protein
MLSRVVQALSQSPHHMGSLADADAIGREGAPGEGPHMLMYLRMAGDRIGEAWFETYGCPNAVACGSWVTHWVQGRTPKEALILEAEDLRKVLGGLPLGKEGCADLAVNSLRDALRQVGGFCVAEDKANEHWT